MPTILDAAGVQVPANVDGRSLRPLLSGQTDWADDRKLIVQCPRGRNRKKDTNVSVKTRKWRLVNGAKLYDAEKDWLQKHNVADAHPEVVSVLQAHYDEFWKSLPSVEDVRPIILISGPEVSEVRFDTHAW